MRVLFLIVFLFFSANSFSAGSFTDSFHIGKKPSSGSDVFLELGNGKIKYSPSKSRIEVANDGVNFKNLGSGGSGINFFEIGDFESGVSAWAGSGTFTATTTSFNGQYSANWSMTSTGTREYVFDTSKWLGTDLDFSVYTNSQSPDLYFCVQTPSETCVQNSNQIGWRQLKVSATASTSAKLILKYLGSSINSLFDDVTIKPAALERVQTVASESFFANLAPTTLGNYYSFPGTIYSDTSKNLFSYSGSTLYVKKKAVFNINILGGNVIQSTSGVWSVQVEVNGFKHKAFGTESGTDQTTAYLSSSFSSSLELNSGDIVKIYCSNNVAPTDLLFSITATEIRDNVIQTWQTSDRLGETILLQQNLAPRGFISAQGSILGKSSGTHQGDAYFDLYKLEWNFATTASDAIYQISSAKGSDALSDWNAGKTIKINSGASNYTFIRYSNSGPTLLALPSATQKDYFIEASGNAGQTITGNVTDTPFILTKQSNAFWDGSVFTAPEDGNYDVKGSASHSSTGGTLYIYKKTIGGAFAKLSAIQSSSIGQTVSPFSGKVYLIRGEQISIRSDTNRTLINDSTNHWISITRLNGKNDSVLPTNINLESAVFSVSYGGSSSGACSSTPCAYLDQIKETILNKEVVTSVSRSSAGVYVVNLLKSYSKIKCSINTMIPAQAFSLISPVQNGNQISFSTYNSSGVPVDTFGTLLCHAY